MLDLHWREAAIFAPMIAVVLWMGIYPSSFLKPMQPSLAKLVEHIQLSLHENAAAKLAER